MANPIFGIFSNPQQQQPTMMQKFQQFANVFRGDPKQTVQELLNSGKMTQDQFNQFSNIANQITGRKGL